MGSGGSKTANSGGKTQSVAKQETGGNKPQTETLEFYFAKPSPPSRVVWMILKALDLKFEPKLVDIARGENKLPDFLAMNPRGKVPTVKDGDFCVAERLVNKLFFISGWRKLLRYITDSVCVWVQEKPSDVKR